MIGRVTWQSSRERLLKCLFSRSDGRGQGRRQPAREARGPLTAGRRGGYPLLTPVLTQPATRVRFERGNSTPKLDLPSPKWIHCYNTERPDQALGYRSPRQFRGLQPETRGSIPGSTTPSSTVPEWASKLAETLLARRRARRAGGSDRFGLPPSRASRVRAHPIKLRRLYQFIGRAIMLTHGRSFRTELMRPQVNPSRASRPRL
jgi:hypothetical protein